MGFDIHGINPKIHAERPSDDNPGLYFRNNVWWWRPLWEYVTEMCFDVMSEEDRKGGNFNSGYEINEQTTIEMVKVLTILVKSGFVKEYERTYKEMQENAELEECNLCNGTGKRDDKHVKGKCNKCFGKGEHEPFDNNYPFDEENVINFIEFLEESGGIKIC
jgi:hypothetical protein